MSCGCSDSTVALPMCTAMWQRVLGGGHQCPERLPRPVLQSFLKEETKGCENHTKYCKIIVENIFQSGQLWDLLISLF